MAIWIEKYSESATLSLKHWLGENMFLKWNGKAHIGETRALVRRMRARLMVRRHLIFWPRWTPILEHYCIILIDGTSVSWPSMTYMFHRRVTCPTTTLCHHVPSPSYSHPRCPFCVDSSWVVMTVLCFLELQSSVSSSKWRKRSYHSSTLRLSASGSPRSALPDFLFILFACLDTIVWFLSLG